MSPHIGPHKGPPNRHPLRIIGFQQDTKIKINLASKQVKSALLQASFKMTLKEPRRTNPDQARSEERNNQKSLLTIDK